MLPWVLWEKWWHFATPSVVSKPMHHECIPPIQSWRAMQGKVFLQSLGTLALHQELESSVIQGPA